MLLAKFTLPVTIPTADFSPLRILEPQRGFDSILYARSSVSDQRYPHQAAAVRISGTSQGSESPVGLRGNRLAFVG